MQPVSYGSGRCPAELAGVLRQIGLINGDDLRYVDYARLGEVCLAILQQDTTCGSASPLEIRQTTLVAIALRLKTSFCTTMQECLPEGAEPAEGPESASKPVRGELRSRGIFYGPPKPDFGALDEIAFLLVHPGATHLIQPREHAFLPLTREKFADGESEKSVATKTHLARRLVRFRQQAIVY